MTTLTIHLEDERARMLEKEAARAGVSVEEWVRRRLGTGPKPAGKNKFEAGKKALKEFRAQLPANYTPPSDEDVSKILEERRMRHVK